VGLLCPLQLDGSCKQMWSQRNGQGTKNAKSREKKKTTQPRNNIADEILAVLSMMNEHPFVQQVILITPRKKVPVFLITFLKKKYGRYM
jgi:hypothetical protein